MKKFKRAVTDSESEIKYDENRKGLHNLINIYSAQDAPTLPAPTIVTFIFKHLF